jgi:hypothetical protein
VLVGEAEPEPEPEATSEPESEPGLAPEPDSPPESEAAPPSEPAVLQPTPSSGPVNLNSASYDDLRGLGLSVTQTGRVLAFREREGSFKSLDELDSIAGFPRGFLDDLKTKLSLS